VYHPLDFIHSLTLTVRYGFAPTDAEQHVRQQWDDMKSDSEEYLRRQKIEEARLMDQREKLRREAKWSVLYYKAQREFDAKKYADAKLTLGQILADDPRHEAAKALMDEITTREDTTTVTLRLKHCEDSYRNADYAGALKDVNFILGVQPGNPKAQLLGFLIRAHLFIDDKRFNDAKGELIEVIKLDPDNQEAGQLLKRLQTVLDMNQENKQE
jgi:tetratricopeptide (TPR) repeat protein